MEGSNLRKKNNGKFGLMIFVVLGTIGILIVLFIADSPELLNVFVGWDLLIALQWGILHPLYIILKILVIIVIIFEIVFLNTIDKGDNLNE